MEKLISNFPKQLQEALDIGATIPASPPSNSKIDNVLIVGLGGSGIGGTIVQNYLNPICKIPIIVSKNYFIPSFVGEHTLVIISSYSGNTEETINAFNESMTLSKNICVVTSGGHIASMAIENGLRISLIPSGMPPRACLGYNFVQVLFFLHSYGIITSSFTDELVDSILLLESQQSYINKESRHLAEKLHNKIPVIYTEANYEGVAIRWRQQINENAKMLCWHHIIPEMNHNELVGWTEQNDNLAVIFLRSKDDYERSQYRMEINKKIISQYTDQIFEIFAQGTSYLQQALYLIHYGDWLSLHLGNLKNIDITEVKVIDYLKSELSKK